VKEGPVQFNCDFTKGACALCKYFQFRKGSERVGECKLGKASHVIENASWACHDRKPIGRLP
jgi:hypothetical protein